MATRYTISVSKQFFTYIHRMIPTEKTGLRWWIWRVRRRQVRQEFAVVTFERRLQA